MKRSVASLVAFLAPLLQGAVAETPPSPAPAVLRWNNGETLPGELIEASATDLHWKSPLFDDPLRLHWHAVRRIDRELPSVPVTDQFSIVLRDGSHLYGDIVALTEQFVSIRSTRHGEAVLNRSEVLSLRRLRGDNLIFAGPTGDVGWKDATDSKRGNSELSTPQGSPVRPFAGGVGGALVFPYWNRAAELPLGPPKPIPGEARSPSPAQSEFRLSLRRGAGADQALKIEKPDPMSYLQHTAQARETLPELVDIEFRVRSSARPDFRLSLGADAGDAIKVETWDEDLVLATNDQFKTIRKLKDDERELALRLFWNRKQRHCSLLTPGGEVISQWEVPQQSGSVPPGIALHNKGRDLTLEFLRVRRWDGKPPSKFDVKQPRVELVDGRVLAGEIASISANTLTLRTGGDSTQLSIPLSEAEALILSAQSPELTAGEATLSYADGTLLTGKTVSVKDGQFALKTSLSEQPLVARVDGLRQLLIKAPAPAGALPEEPFAALDRLASDGTTIHGKVAGGGDDRLRWVPVGGVAPVTLSRTPGMEVMRALGANGEFPSTPALFYTSTGDVLPGRLRALDRSGAEFECSLIEATKLPAANLDAVQLGSASQLKIEGFADPGWRVLKGDEKSVRKTAESFTLEPGATVGHPSVMQANELKFSIDFNSGSSVRLRLFCAGTDSAQSHNLLLSHWGNRVEWGLESSDDQIENGSQTGVASGRSLMVRLTVQGSQIELHLNDVLSGRVPIDSSKRAGVGIVIEPASMFGNPVRAVTLSRFSARSEPGRTWLPEINYESKIHALTVPRFRKEDPPRHALLARNGDVLRGEIEASTATHFAFRSGLETLRVPRDRVKAAIWLKRPSPGSEAPAVQAPVQNRLQQRIARQVRFSRASLSSYIRVLQREAPNLKFKLPEDDETRQVPMQIGGQTIAEALNHICSLFDLNYHVAKDGTIVLEAGPKVGKDEIEKVYWLEKDPFGGNSPQEVLSAKGIKFLARAAVSWHAESLQLEMTNSAVNHAKVHELITRELGGTVGSPTHWLLLTNGARLGLAVDKFETDSISGHHPRYGRCNVPLADVYLIRTLAPEPSATMKALSDWRLVHAPEPVLPETGGENSPLLGKEAKSFKLPLLAGGEFDMSKARGKVVVLDFWATWCGPCIKSLPGLIEAISAFPPDQVKLIGVNQSEPAEQVKRFLETRNWDLVVAMDAGQSVSREYGVDGIPHTVVVGPDGKVAWTKTGYSREGATEVANAVRQLLPAP